MSARAAPDVLRWLEPAYRTLSSLRSLPLIVIGLFTVGYFAATCSLASLKPLGFDELTTYNIARSPTSETVWRTWWESGDGVPPMVHLALHVVGSALGFSEVTVRLPDMVGFWFMCLCLFAFLRRRVPSMIALAGMILPVTVPLAYSYAYEARGYGMVLGFAAAAVVCWDLTQQRRWRPWARIGLPIALAGAIMTHLYAVLIVPPLALAELARSIERRRVDWVVWLGLIAPAVVVLPINPVIAHINRLPELALYAFRGRVGASDLMELWGQFLSLPVVYLGLLALACLGPGRTFARDDPLTRDGQGGWADWILVIGLAMLPLVGWPFAKLVTGLLLFRYVIATVIGCSLGVAMLCWVAVRRRPALALLMLAWIAVTAAGSSISVRHTLRSTTITTEHIGAGRQCFRLLKLGERLPQNDLPIVVTDFYLFHQIHHYASVPLRRRLVFLVDREFGRLNTPYLSFYAKIFGVRMVPFGEFVRSYPSFYLYDCGSPFRIPLMTMLIEAGASVRDSGLVDTPDILLRRDLYRVSMTPASPETTIRR